MSVYRLADGTSFEALQLPLYKYDSTKCKACLIAFDRSTDYPKFKERFSARCGRWWQRCTEARPHMHVGCKRCGAEWVTAPAEDGRFV